MATNNTINISGVIVPSDFDGDWFADEIELGLITPLSRVQKAIAAADPSAALIVKINSPGGSVFAAYEMVNSLVEWRIANKQPIQIVAGAMAASAASCICTMLGPVSAHENTKFMYHSAVSVSIGGPGAMEDTRDLLDKINAEITMALVNRYNADPDMVAEWFQEGRMGWLTANEAQQIGLVKEIIPVQADEIEFTEQDINGMQARGLSVAAMLETNKETGEGKMETIIQKIKSLLGIETDVEDEIVTAIDGATEAQKAAQDASYDEGLNAGKEQASKELATATEVRMQKVIDELQEQLVDAEEEGTANDALIEAANETMKEKVAELETAHARIKELDKGFKDGDDGTGSGDPETFWNKVDELVAEGSSKNAAMLKVQREFPELHKEMLEMAATTDQTQ